MKRGKIGAFLAILFSCSYIAYEIMYVILDQRNEAVPWLYYIFTGFLVTLTLTYTIICALLLKTMNKLVGNFKKEICSVICQFFVFLQAYASMSAYSAALTSERIKEKIGMDNLNIFYLIMVFFWQVSPPFTMLLLHHRAFYRRRM